jgi:hypothetical protein
MENKQVYLLFEVYEDKTITKDVIGVISEPNNYIKILDDYYGKERWEEISYRDIRDSTLEWIRKIIWNCDGEWIEVEIICEMFLVDELF